METMESLGEKRDAMDDKEINDFVNCGLCHAQIWIYATTKTQKAHYCLICWFKERTIRDEVSIEW